MLRRSRCIPALAVAACGLLAAACSAPAGGRRPGPARPHPSDGGQHWTQLRPALAPAGLVDVLSPGTALAAQDAGDAGAILRSADGGRSWTELADLPGVTWRTSDGGTGWTRG